MADENRDDLGRFASPVYGQESIEREAGYVPMKRPEEEQELSIEDALELLPAPAEEDPPPIVYEGAADNETLTLEQAASDFTAFLQQENEAADQESKDTFAADVDKDRAEAINGDPRLAEHFGVEIPKVEDARPEAVETTAARQVETPPAPEAVPAEILESHPRVREAEHATQRFHQAAAAANNTLLAIIHDQFPELAAGKSQEDWESTLATIHAQNPERYAKIANLVQQSERITAAQQQEFQERSLKIAAVATAYMREQDAIFEQSVSQYPAEQQRAIERELLGSMKAAGIEPATLTQMFKTQPFLRSAAVQTWIFDRVRDSMELASIRNAPKAVLKPNLPPVQRPGVARSAGNALSDREMVLSRKSELTEKEGAELYALTMNRSRARG